MRYQILRDGKPPEFEFDHPGPLPLLVLIVFLSLFLFGCATRPYTGPKWQGPWPKGVACGERTKMDDGSEWIFPCWPEKNEPKCVSGCKCVSKMATNPKYSHREYMRSYRKRKPQYDNELYRNNRFCISERRREKWWRLHAKLTQDMYGENLKKA